MSPAPLLDTYAWVWWLHGDPRLGRDVIASLDELPPDSRPAVSDISLWEVATLVSLGRLELGSTLEAWLALATHPKTVRVLPVTSEVAAEVARLPDSFHRDPADRLIVATSRVHGLPLLTRDIAVARSGLVRLWSPGLTTEPSLRELLPRVFELKDAVDAPAHPNAYFKDFETSLPQQPGKVNAFLRVERQLALLDPASWADLKTRAAKHLISTQRDAGRGWQQLFDTLNEARAFGYLRRTGHTTIRFIPRAANPTPDLEAVLDGQQVLCEVKTVNISDERAQQNQRASSGEVFVTDTIATLPAAFLEAKLWPTIERAVEQLSAHDPDRVSRWLLFIVLNFDDVLGEYQDRYLRQIDEYLLAKGPLAAQLVFSPSASYFEQNLTMRSAAVYLS